MITTPPNLARFFVFNPEKFGLREDNDTEKILYFWPEAYEKKMADVGLCEALTNFTRTFSEHPPSSCETEKVRYILQKPEPGWWSVMVVQNPKILTKDGKEEWNSTFLDDNALQAMLTHLNHHFRLFHGKYEYLLALHGETEIRAVLKSLWDPLVTEIDPKKADIFTSLNEVSNVVNYRILLTQGLGNH
eukprot:TRINITY_DN11579_c0_g1_i6.p1 TRINITY_DN11579_c0_g1~~TRINITY_DN11579_c0_g1_i6.p1  ORF type:complete len:212 (+),score=43.32 TRINITY_DN11579_c0_g1_i6:71-637(+)